MHSKEHMGHLPNQVNKIFDKSDTRANGLWDSTKVIPFCVSQLMQVTHTRTNKKKHMKKWTYVKEKINKIWSWMKVSQTKPS